MNNKKRKLSFIQYKNKFKHLYPAPKWKLKRNRLPAQWINMQPLLYEESWVFDIRGSLPYRFKQSDNDSKAS